MTPIKCPQCESTKLVRDGDVVECPKCDIIVMEES